MYDCKSLATVVLPENLNTIGARAFYGCSGLSEIVIPDKVINMGEYAFSGCTDLTIYCEWENAFSEWDENWNDSDLPVYYYSESEPVLNNDGTDYNGKYWHYVDDEIVVWTYTKEE